MKAAVDPKSAAEHVQKVFASFSKLPKAEQRLLLEQYVAKIVYHESKCHLAILGQCGYSTLK
jgi:hypothetical protein